jgi:hypothetical protein
MFSFPDIDFAPLQFPEAEQEVAFVEDQVRVNSSSVVTVVDEELRLILGTGVKGAGLEPPPPPPPPHEVTTKRARTE